MNVSPATAAAQRVDGERVGSPGATPNIPRLMSGTDSTGTSSSDSGGSTARQRATSRVRLPPSTIRALHVSLAGPPQLEKLCFSMEGRVRAWAWAGPLAGASVGGWGVMLMWLETDVPIWAALGYVAFGVWLIVGVTMSESTQVMARAVIGILQSSPGIVAGSGTSVGTPLGQSLTSSAEPELETGSPRHIEEQHRQEQSANVAFMERLLRSRVSAPVAKKIRMRVKIAIVQSLLFAAVLEVNFLGMAWSMATWDVPHVSMVYAFLALAIFSVPIMSAIMVGFILFFTVPCDVATDRIRQEAARVRATDAANADWNAIMGGVQEAHEATVRIGALMRPPLTSFHIVGIFAGSWWFACAVVPHDVLPDNHPLREYFTGPIFFLMTMGATLNGIMPLYYPAGTSHACDELVVAIAALRQSETPAPADSGGGGQEVQQSTNRPRPGVRSPAQVILASPTNLIRIDGICRYAAELNRGQGLGFTLGRLRIDNTFVTKLVLRAVFIVCVLFPVWCEYFSSDAYMFFIPWD
jgi:hypothetical protein